MHNDWSTGQSIFIKVYAHKLVISNRSIVDKGWTVEKHSSRHINPLISSVFSKAGFVEKFGTGISKILDACKNEGNPEPIFDTASDGFDFTVTFEVSELYLALEKYRESLDPKSGFVDYKKVIASIDSGTMKYPDSSIKNLVSTTSDPDGTNDPNIDPNDDTDTVPDGVIIPAPDDESPEITEAEAARARFAHESHPEWYRTVPVKQQISIKIDKDILEALKAEGKGYQTRINKI